MRWATQVGARLISTFDSSDLVKLALAPPLSPTHTLSLSLSSRMRSPFPCVYPSPVLFPFSCLHTPFPRNKTKQNTRVYDTCAWSCDAHGLNASARRKRSEVARPATAVYHISLYVRVGGSAPRRLKIIPTLSLTKPPSNPTLGATKIWLAACLGSRWRRRLRSRLCCGGTARAPRPRPRLTRRRTTESASPAPLSKIEALTATVLEVWRCCCL